MGSVWEWGALSGGSLSEGWLVLPAAPGAVEWSAPLLAAVAQLLPEGREESALVEAGSGEARSTRLRISSGSTFTSRPGRGEQKKCSGLAQ